MRAVRHFAVTSARQDKYVIGVRAAGQKGEEAHVRVSRPVSGGSLRFRAASTQRNATQRSASQVE